MTNSQLDNLDPQFNDNVQFDFNDPAVRNALRVIEVQHKSEKSIKDTDNRRIQDLFEDGFLVRNPRGTRKIHSKKLYQAVWRTANRMKPLDFVLHGTGRPREIERIVTGGVATVMDRGGYLNALRSKQGAFFNLLMYGDGFIQVGSNPKDKSTPILYNSISNNNVYFDNFATGMRATGWGRACTKCVVIFSHSWAEFVSLFPEMKNKAGLGRIPREYDPHKELERWKEDQQSLEPEDLVEVAYAYDIVNKNYCAFAGKGATKIFEFKGEDYPFIFNKTPYIPVLQFMCMPSSEGFYNKGIGSMIYELSLISQRLLNMEVGHIEENTYPIELINLPQGEATNFFKKLNAAHKMRAAGRRGYLPVEYDSTGSNAVTSQSLVTQNLFNEWQAIFDRLDRELVRMGIVLDEVDRSGNPTATQILAEEENANSFVKQIMEYNASESKFAVDLTMDQVVEFIPPKNKEPLNLTTKIEINGEEFRADGITMGMVKKELKDHNYFTVITGAYPSNALRNAQLSRVLQVVPPGSPAQVRAIKELASLHGFEMAGNELGQQAPQTEGLEEEAIETGTQRGNINPRIAETSNV